MCNPVPFEAELPDNLKGDIAIALAAQIARARGQASKIPARFISSRSCREMCGQ